MSGEVGSGEPLPGTPSRNRSSAKWTTLSSLAIAMGRRPMAISAEFGEVHLSDQLFLAPAISRDLPTGIPTPRGSFSDFHSVLYLGTVVWTTSYLPEARLRSPDRPRTSFSQPQSSPSGQSSLPVAPSILPFHPHSPPPPEGDPLACRERALHTRLAKHAH